MADNDRFRGLARRWRRSYMQLCELDVPIESISRTTLKALKRSVQHYKNPPIYFLDAMSHVIQDPINQSIQQYLREGHLVRQELVTLHDSPARGLDLANRAFLRHANRAFAAADLLEVNEHFPMLIYGYLDQVYTSDYEENVLSQMIHHEEVSQVEITYRLNLIRPAVEDGMSYFAETLTKYQDVNKLRMPPRKNRRVFELHTPLN